MKGNFWRKIFRKGYNTKDARYNGYCAKTDANTSRSKLKRFFQRNDEEEIVWKNYDAEQCSRRRWNEEEQKWERAFGQCAICSYMCPQRAEDFAKMGKKEYVDKTTGLHFWK